MALMHPDIVIYWNGRKMAEGLDEAHVLVEVLGFGSTHASRLSTA